jgi:hypothetical protein
MCQICEKDYSATRVYCCENVREISVLFSDIQVLNLKDNRKIETLPDTLCNMTDLYACKSGLLKLPKNMNRLTFLDISYTDIEEIPDNLSFLNYLHCGFCKKIKKIPEKLISLVNLYTQYNRKLTHIPKTLVNLTVIYCSHTNLNELPPSLINVRDLDISGTNILFIPDTYTRLKYLVNSKDQIITSDLSKRPKHEFKYPSDEVSEYFK